MICVQLFMNNILFILVYCFYFLLFHLQTTFEICFCSLIDLKSVQYKNKTIYFLKHSTWEHLETN